VEVYILLYQTGNRIQRTLTGCPKHKILINVFTWLSEIGIKIRTQKVVFSKCLLYLGVVCVFVLFCLGFCTDHFVVIRLNLTCLHCLQHSFFEHLLNLYYSTFKKPVNESHFNRYQTLFTMIFLNNK